MRTVTDQAPPAKPASTDALFSAVYDELPLLLAGYAAFRDRRGPGALDDAPRRRALDGLVRLYEAQGRLTEAARYRAQLTP